MNWLALLVALVKAVAEFSRFLSSRQLIEAGKAQVIADGLNQTLANIAKANTAAVAAADPASDFSARVRTRFERKPGE